MEKVIEFSKNLGHTVIYLNACPVGFTGLSLGDLVGFYKKFGFEIIVDDYSQNKEIIKRI